jgi:1,4-dihydroxy-2-naphthoyl-CoA hydrolase
VAGERAFETDAWHSTMPFGKTLGAVLLAGGRAEVRARLAWAPELCTTGGVLHGGAIMGLADGVAGTCAFLNLPDGATGTATISSSTSFLRAVRDGHVEAVARPLRVGRSIVVIETDVVDAEDNLVARVTQSQAVLR